MAVECVIFDVSDTLIDKSGRAIPGIKETIGRLSGLGVKIVAVHNDSPQASVARKLQDAGIHFDHVITQDEVGKRKRSPEWIRYIKQITGLKTNQLLYIGDSDGDMITASQGHVIYAHAGWAGPKGDYGLLAPTPGWVAAVVEHIFRKKHRWWWTLNYTDKEGHQVRKMALIDGKGAGDANLKAKLITVFKNKGSAMAGRMPIKEFVMLHLIASMYEEGLTTQAGWWTNYPGHDAGTNSVMEDFLDISAKLFRRKYQGNLFVRHKVAKKSVKARQEEDIKGALRNQFSTVQLNDVAREKLNDMSVLIVDDFITSGPTTEAGRNLLLAGGATDVICVSIGKYGYSNHVISVTGLDPYKTSHAGVKYQDDEVAGQYHAAALEEFVASYKAIAAEKW